MEIGRKRVRRRLTGIQPRQHSIKAPKLLVRRRRKSRFKTWFPRFATGLRSATKKRSISRRLPRRKTKDSALDPVVVISQSKRIAQDLIGNTFKFQRRRFCIGESLQLQ